MLQPYHPFFPTFKRIMAEAASHAPAYDLGTSARFAKEMGLVRHFFDEVTYRAGGYRPVPGTCDFDCDIQNLSGIADGEAGSVLCLSVLEHVIDPKAAVREMYRILRPGGLAVITAPFFVSYHGKSRQHDIVDSSHEGYGDFWRFTHEGLALMFKMAGFSRIDLYPMDGPVISRLEIMGLYPRLSRISFLRALISAFDYPRLGRATTMHLVRAEK